MQQPFLDHEFPFDPSNGLFRDEVSISLHQLVQICYFASFSVGWWDDTRTGLPIDRTDLNIQGTKIALMHSELSEGLEGIRTGAMSDKIPDCTQIAEELADTVIRIFDFCGALNIPIWEAFPEKLIYNRHRLDHKKENREQVGGKAF